VNKPIPGIAPIRELLDGAHPQFFDLATHIFTEDAKKTTENLTGMLHIITILTGLKNGTNQLRLAA
jgi:hypothetical protein